MSVLQLRRPEGLSLTLSTQGAAWLQCEVPLPDGSRRPVILPRGEPATAGARGYFLGATVGRYANRIADGRITRDGQTWTLAVPTGERHHLHGGPGGFHARTWQIERYADAEAALALVSPAGDQGYPGDVHLTVRYRLSGPMTIEMESIARTTAPCPVGITNHAYFNLDGHAGDARAHHLQIHAAQWLPVDADLIPLGALAPVGGTSFDFRHPKPLQQHWLADDQQRQAGGYDHAFLLDERCRGLEQPALTLRAADGQLAMQLFTTLPALQLYSGQGLQGVQTPADETLPACAGIALEPQFLPDSPNHPEWPQPSCWLEPGQTYRHLIRWHFLA